MTLLLVLLTGCGQDGPPTRVPAKAPEFAVRAVAKRYYDAFGARRLREACGYVAARTLESVDVVGANVRDDGKPRVRPSALATGCALVRRRRRGWEEPILARRGASKPSTSMRPGERARIDTSAGGPTG